jgi:hypothetical protein
MKRLASFLMVAIVAAAASLPTDARACSLAGPSPYTVNTSLQAIDHVAPTLPPPSVTRLRRGEEYSGCMGGNSCDGLASLALGVAPSDDVTPATDIGYRFSLVAGGLPPSFTIILDRPSQFFMSDGELWFSWGDGTEDHAPIDFTLEVVAIDRAGNESAPQTVRVQDAGSSGGCAIARPSQPARGLAWFALAALVLAARRRR